MLVDDRPDKLMAMESVLAELGQNIVKAGSGAEALRLLLRDDYAVILLDVRMPVMDGFETATLIRNRARSAHVPIIFVSAIDAAEAHVQRGYALGAVDYIFAPLVPDILRAKVAVFIDLFLKSQQIERQAEQLRVAAERHASTVETRFQDLLNRLNVGVFRSDHDGRVVEANPAFLRLLGISSLAAIDSVDLRRLQLHQTTTDTYPALRDGVPPPIDGDVSLRRADGSVIWVSLSKTLVDAADGTLGTHGTQGISGMIEDITARKEAETALAAKATELARSNHELAQFASVASHDLQEPLRMVSAYLDLLRLRCADRLDDKGLEYLGYVLDGAMRMRRLINDLLTYSQIGSRDAPRSQVDAEAVLTEVLANLSATIAESGATVSHGELPRLWMDRVQLVQLFQNLIGNALKFTSPRPPTVRISARRAGDDWVFSVADNGIGIDPHHHQQIFELFRRLHSGDRYPGTGIGLASCKRIVELCGGRIWVESAVDVGTTFHFSLPAALPTEADGQSTASSQRLVDVSRGR